MKTVIILLLWINIAHAGIVLKFNDSAQATKLNNGSQVMHYQEIKSINPAARGYNILQTPLNDITKALGFDVIKYIEDRQGKETVIMDWGCGEASMLNEVAKQLRHAGITNVKLYGFSDLYFSAWSTNDKMITYLYGDMEELKSFNIPKVDLVLSHYGLFHIENDKLVKHFQDFRSILNNSGQIIYNTRDSTKDGLIDLTFFYDIDIDYKTTPKTHRLKLKTNGSYFYSGSYPIEREELWKIE